MTLDGTVVNGVIVLDGSPALPEGARARVELTDGDEWPDGLAPPTDSYVEHLAKLRQSIADAEAGIGLMSVSESFDQIRAELGLPRAGEG